jgi:hypothetical protein
MTAGFIGGGRAFADGDRFLEALAVLERDPERLKRRVAVCRTKSRHASALA